MKFTWRGLARTVAYTSVFVCATAACSSLNAELAKNRQQSQAPASKFRVVKTVCGAKGVSHGALFEMQDTRNVFHVPEDHEIIVYFEWEGPPGSHHAEGLWRSPDGKVALNSDFDLISTGTRYTGTWRLALPETITAGLWALEAQIDGAPAGTQTFEIISSAPPPPPSAGEVYQRSAAASVFVTSLDADGEAISHGLGFFVDKGTVLTAFQVVDGATSVRVDLADGSNVKVNNVSGWSRREDWAVLKVDSPGVQPLEKAAPNSWKIGDLGYVLTAQGAGGRAIQNVNITGLQGLQPAAQRLTISAVGGGMALGSPFLDAYGRVVGILSGGRFGGRRMGLWAAYVEPGETAATLPQMTVRPISGIPDTAMSQTPVAFADLQTQGALMLPIVRSPQAAVGTVCEDFQKVHGIAITPVRVRYEFPLQLGSFAVVITWGPNENVKAPQQLRIFDDDNHPVLQTAPSPLSLETHVTAYSAWRVPFGSLKPGTYRVDLLLGDQTQWREFIRISD